MVNYYNQAEAGSQDRADALRVIWGKGGVPVIGSGKERAGVQNFRGVGTGLAARGIDTGMAPGSPEAEAHAAALAAHKNQSGIYGSPEAPYARLAPLRTNRGDGLFSRGRVTRNLSKEDQKLERAIKLQQAQNEGQVGAASQYAKAAETDRAASREDRNARIAEENIARQQQREDEAALARQIAEADAAAPVRQVGKDGLPYSVWTENGRVKRELAIPKEDVALYQQANNNVFTKRFSRAFPPQMILQWAQNPAGAEPVIDQKTGAPALTSPDNIVKDKKTGNYGQYRPMTKYEREVFDEYVNEELMAAQNS